MTNTFAANKFSVALSKQRKLGFQACKHTMLCGVAALGLMMGASPAALANPAGGNVVSGTATIVNTPNELQIHQTSDSTLIEWDSFDIGRGETTRFYQPGSESLAINRVVNTDQISAINGNLQANGRVVIINPNGILIGESGKVDTAGFLATTADIDADALAANKVLKFNKAGKIDGVVENRGSITVGEAGLAGLVAPTVRNSGIIQGNLAKVQLAAADTFAVDFYGDGLIQFAVDAPKDGETREIKAENTGKIIADGGAVLMTAAAASDVVNSVINSDGYIQAASLQKKGGKIVLTGAGADVKVSGKLDVSGKDGANGGEIKIGGDYQGKGDLAKAKTVNIADGTQISADGGSNGDGGQIIVWSEDSTTSRATFSARGYENGGLVETSAKYLLDVDGTTVNTLAENGKAGVWLLDPDNIIISNSGLAYNSVLPATGTSTIDVATINAALSNVVLQANNGITISADINIAASGVGVALIAGVSGSDISGTAFGTTYNLAAGTGTISFTNQFIRTEGGDVYFISGKSVTQNNATIYTNGGDITMISGDIGINNNAALGSFGGNVLLRAIAAGSGSTKTSGDVSTNSSYIDTTDAGAPGIGGITLTENGAPLAQGDYGNPQNVFVQTDNGGSITIEGKTIGGNSVCFAAGGTGCLVPDPVATDIVVTIDDFQKIYGVLDPFFTWSITSGTLDGGDVLNVDLARILQNTLAGEQVGNYDIYQTAYSITGSGLYNITFINGNLEIVPASLVVKAIDQTKTYGDTLVFDTGSDFEVVSGLVNTVNGFTTNDAVTNVDLASTGAAAGAGVVGSPYTITSSNATGSGLSNYTIIYQTGDLTVNPAALTVTANDDAKVYDAVAYSGGNGVTYAGFVNGDDSGDLGGSLTYGGTSQGATNVGGYDIEASGLTSANYDITYVDGALTITPAALTITADNQTKTYGDAFSFVGTEFSTSGLVGSDTVTALDLASAAESALANAGTYNITAANASGTGLSNYTISYVDGTFTVDKALIQVTAEDKSMIYGGSFPTLTATYTGFKNSDTLGDIDTVATLASGTAATADAGTYVDTLTASGAADNNYTFAYNAGDLTINKAALTVTANDDAKVYDAAAYSGGNGVTYAGFVNGDDSGDLGGSLTYGGTSQGAKNVGGYDIEASGLTSGNYDITYVDGALDITPATLIITADDINKTYGNEYTFVGDEFSFSGLYAGDGITGIDLSSAGTPYNANVGSYTIDISNATGNGLTNYAITYNAGTMKIDPALLRIIAKDQNKTYGDAFSFAGNEFTFSGLYAGDGITGVDLASAAEPTTANVGTYTITVSNASGSGLTNYTIDYVDGTFTVDKAALTVTANDDAKVYDAAAYSGGNGVTYAGFVNGETQAVLGGALGYSGTSQGATNVGTYGISAGGYTSQNYTISYVDGTLEIDPAILQVIADNKVKIYGDADPAFTYTVSGLQGSDTVGGVLSGDLTRYSGENVGYYSIIQGSLGLTSGNYQMDFDNGLLEITPATLTVAADPQSKFVGQVDPELTYTVSGFKFDDTEADTLTGELTRVPGEEVGDYDILQGTLDLANNNQQTLTVQKIARYRSNYILNYIPNVLTINAIAENAIQQFDPLGRPIISVANQAIVLDEPFEQIETLELNTNVGISASTTPTSPQVLAGITPAAGGENSDSPDELASISPAAGGEGNQGQGGAGTQGEDNNNPYARDIACANNFLDDNPCDVEDL